MGPQGSLRPSVSVERSGIRKTRWVWIGPYSGRSIPTATARSTESNRRARGLFPSALRAVAVGCDRPEYGPITTNRALRRPEAFVDCVPTRNPALPLDAPVVGAHHAKGVEMDGRKRAIAIVCLALPLLGMGMLGGGGPNTLERNYEGTFVD